MNFPESVQNRVTRFAERRGAFTSKGYKETELRREFIDPFFEALGWDVQNERGAPEPYKDVVHEASLTVAGAPKAPDYSFRFGGRRQFFVETKRPAANLDRDPSPAYQLRRYGWSAKLPISILTDFEEFAVYDTRVRPEKEDSAKTARLFYITFDEYEDHWDDIYGLFSKEAIRSGRLDDYAHETRTRRGQSPVDDEFLEEIESWRRQLADDIASNNPHLTERELNAAVQRTIDRIIFLRICEDRGIEDYGELRDAVEGERLYNKLLSRFRQADQKYNSGLFHFEDNPARPGSPDTLTPDLSISDGPLEDIVEDLYYPHSPYEFSVLSPDILGQVYEQFLGRVVVRTDGHAEVVEKPEVQKASGVYYTPEHIVNFIVEATVVERLKGLRPDDVSEIRILDPACGSGSFLLGAYDALLKWHLNWYVNQGLQYKKYQDRVYEAPNDEYRLTTAEKKRILLNNIYGVDIDENAVEVTKLSLLLKLLEGETDHTLEQQLKLFDERALPDLSSNIKCGNSLVESDYYQLEQGALFDDETRYNVNPFDWENQFRSILIAEDGFDIIIGNPPYVFGEYLNEDTKRYFESEYDLAQDQYDTYKLFMERCMGLLAPNGSYSMIVPDPILARDQAQRVRDLLLREGLDLIYHCGPVFSVNVSAVVFRARPGVQEEEIQSYIRKNRRVKHERSCSKQRFLTDSKLRLMVHAGDKEANVLRKLERIRSLGSVMEISRGEEVGRKDTEGDGDYEVLIGDDISPFRVSYQDRKLDEIHKDSEYYTSPKIVVVKTGKYPVAAVERDNHYTIQSVYNLHLRNGYDIDLRYIAGILNSEVARFFIYKTFTAYKLLYPQLNQSTVRSIPIPDVSEQDEEKVSTIASRLEDLWRDLEKPSTSASDERLKRQIRATEQRLDKAVCGAMGLAEDETEMVMSWSEVEIDT